MQERPVAAKEAQKAEWSRNKILQYDFAVALAQLHVSAESLANEQKERETLQEKLKAAEAAVEDEGSCCIVWGRL